MEVKMSYKDIGFRIRSLREANCYTRDALAEKVDISAKFLYEIDKKDFPDGFIASGTESFVFKFPEL